MFLVQLVPFRHVDFVQAEKDVRSSSCDHGQCLVLRVVWCAEEFVDCEHQQTYAG